MNPLKTRLGGTFQRRLDSSNLCRPHSIAARCSCWLRRIFMFLLFMGQSWVCWSYLNSVVNKITKMNWNNSYERCWLCMHATHCRPEQKHGGEGAPSIAPRQGEAGEGWGELQVRSWCNINWFLQLAISGETSLSAGYFSGIHATSRSEEPQLRMSSSLFFILPALGGYALVSQYLLKNPLILHKKKRLGFYCTHISHRGGKSDRGAPLSPGTGGTWPTKAAAGWSDSVPLCTQTPAPETIARHPKSGVFSSTCCCAGLSDIPKHVLASVLPPELTTKLCLLPGCGERIEGTMEAFTQWVPVAHRFILMSD